METDIEEMDSDEDTEIQLNELKQLNEALEADEPSTSELISRSSAIVPAANSTISSNTIKDYHKIDKALFFNKLSDEKFGKLENILFNRLRECRQKLSNIRDSGKLNSIDKPEVFRYFNCGKPYFKDKSSFSAPDNDDTVIMAKSQMYDFSNVMSVPGWTVKDKTEFMEALRDMSQVIRKKEINTKIAQIQRDNKLKKNKKSEALIKGLKKEIESLKKKPLSEIALPLDQEYDWDMLANKLNRRHTAQEYQGLWKLFFHPSINKDSWSKGEHMSLQKIAKENNLQDWDTIAKKHNTNRTGYQTFVYYRTNMNNTFTGRKWTKEEVEYLQRLINFYKEDNYIPWGKVAASMENRTKIQIYNKYLRLIEQRKGRFLPEEDAVILNCLDRFGLNFRKMTSYLPGRSIVQLRTRCKVLSKMRVSTVWTVQEDKRLIQIMSNQSSNMNYSNITKHFPGKDRENLRSRYLTLMRWMKRHPQLDIMSAPRRGARRLSHGHASDDLNKAIENLKNRMQSEVETKKNKRITKDSLEEDIDDAIIATLINEKVKTEENDKAAESREITICDKTTVTASSHNMANLKKLLIFLNAKLDMNKFKNSKLSKDYSELLEGDKEVSTVKIKSYSKKNTVKTIQLHDYPDIWSGNTLGPLNYVFPPHYATITGCRALMMQILPYISKESNAVNLNILMRRNNMIKEQVQHIVERFYTLFVWPMLLSNTGPKIPTINEECNSIIHNLYDCTSVPAAIPLIVNSKCNLNENVSMDLEECDQ